MLQALCFRKNIKIEKLNFVSLPHFVGVENLSAEEVGALVNQAKYSKNDGTTPHLTQPVYISNTFFEGSSRTHTNFGMAERKSGLAVTPFDPAHSSVNKGETLYDTSLIIDAVGIDIEAIRHSQNEYYQDLIHSEKHQHLNIGVIDAGDGSGQHPNQCSLDTMTIHEHFGHFKGLKVAIISDITNSRVAESNIESLTRLDAEVYFSGPEYQYLSGCDKYGEYERLDRLIPEMDVMTFLRAQHGRHSDDPNERNFDAQAYHEEYGINHKRYQELEPDTVIIHPGPISHGVELSGGLAESDKYMFTRQMQNGVFMRMAVIEVISQGRKLGGLN